jgi:hypothetical protein
VNFHRPILVCVGVNGRGTMLLCAMVVSSFGSFRAAVTFQDRRIMIDPLPA